MVGRRHGPHARDVIDRRHVEQKIILNAARFPRTTFALATAVDQVVACIRPDSGSGFDYRGPLGIDASAGIPWMKSARFRYFGASLWHTQQVPPTGDFIAVPDPAGFHGPAVLASVHLGPLPGVAALLSRLPHEVLALVADFPCVGNVRTVHVDGDSGHRAAALQEAAAVLQRGGFVFIAVDGSRTKRVSATILGRRVPLARGGFVLSRLTGAPMVPLLVVWRHRRIEIVPGDPIPAQDEGRMAAELGLWIEQYLTDNPGPYGPGFLNHVLRSPYASDAVTEAQARSDAA